MSIIWEVLKGKFVPPKDTKPSFKGQNVIITGSNVGLGFEAAVKFAELGAERLILGVRTISKGEEAARQIEQRTGRKAEVWQVDMSNYDSVKAFADRASKELKTLDIAVLNAGLANLEYKESVHGHEETLQVNLFSTTLLALLLAPKLKASKTESFTPVLEIIGSSNHYLVGAFG